MNFNDWIMRGQVGVSSKTMWAVFSGIFSGENKLTFGSTDIPYDPDDFSRCYYLVRDYALKDRLNEVSDVFPAWAPFIENWDKLEEMVKEQLETRKANGMYEFMRPLVEKAREINRAL